MNGWYLIVGVGGLMLNVGIFCVNGDVLVGEDGLLDWGFVIGEGGLYERKVISMRIDIVYNWKVCCIFIFGLYVLNF